MPECAELLRVTSGHVQHPSRASEQTSYSGLILDCAPQQVIWPLRLCQFISDKENKRLLPDLPAWCSPPVATCWYPLSTVSSGIWAEEDCPDEFVLSTWCLWAQAVLLAFSLCKDFSWWKRSSWYSPYCIQTDMGFAFALITLYSRSRQAHDLPEGRIQCYCRNWPPASFVASSCHCVVTAKACHSYSVCRLQSLFLLLNAPCYSLEINSAAPIKAS